MASKSIFVHWNLRQHCVIKMCYKDIVLSGIFCPRFIEIDSKDFFISFVHKNISFPIPKALKLLPFCCCDFYRIIGNTFIPFRSFDIKIGDDKFEGIINISHHKIRETHLRHCEWMEQQVVQNADKSFVINYQFDDEKNY